MGDLVPLLDEGHEPFGQVGFVLEVGDAKPLALEDAEPLFDLVHPRAMDGRMVEHESRVLDQPGLHLFPFVHAEIIEDHVDCRDRCGDLVVQLLQERDELFLSLAFGGQSVDFSSASVEPREQVQGSLALVLMLDSHGLIRHRRLGRRLPRARLQAGLLVHTQDHFMRPQTTRIEIADRASQLRKGGISRHFGRQPHLVTPRLQPMIRQNQPHAFDRNRPHDLRRDQLPPNLNAVPLRQRATGQVGAFASDLHCVHRHRRGKKRADDPFEVGHSNRAIAPR